MSRDRFIRWRTRQCPTRSEVEIVCIDYLGGLGQVAWLDHADGVPRFFLSLVGESSHPLQRIGARRTNIHRADRWIEVIPDGSASFDILTREQDAVTNAIADGLAAVFARHWDGEVTT
jgi:hypothetical protein